MTKKLTRLKDAIASCQEKVHSKRQSDIAKLDHKETIEVDLFSTIRTEANQVTEAELAKFRRDGSGDISKVIVAERISAEATAKISALHDEAEKLRRRIGSKYQIGTANFLKPYVDALLPGVESVVVTGSFSDYTGVNVSEIEPSDLPGIAIVATNTPPDFQGAVEVLLVQYRTSLHVKITAYDVEHLLREHNVIAQVQPAGDDVLSIMVHPIAFGDDAPKPIPMDSGNPVPVLSRGKVTVADLGGR